MKRSRIFLGFTSALLAVAGVAAAKAHRGIPVTVYYGTKYDNTTNLIKIGHCQVMPYKTSYTANGIGARGQYSPTNGVGTIIGTYLLYTNSTCVTPGKHNAN